MTNPFLIEPLTAQHRRTGFFCGDAGLDRCLHERSAEPDSRPQASDCFVALDNDGTIAGFYRLAAARLSLSELSDDERGSLPRDGSVPARRIGQLAVDRRFSGQGLAGALVMDAAFRSLQAEPVVFALIADAGNELAASIYEHLGFARFKSRPTTLFIPIETVLRAARAPRASVVPSARR